MARSGLEVTTVVKQHCYAFGLATACLFLQLDYVAADIIPHGYDACVDVATAVRPATPVSIVANGHIQTTAQARHRHTTSTSTAQAQNNKNDKGGGSDANDNKDDDVNDDDDGEDEDDNEDGGDDSAARVPL